MSRRSCVTRGQLATISACVALVTIGFGIVFPLLPSHIERLLATTGVRARVAFHVGAVSAVYAVFQLVLAPFWGRLSDRVGRKRVIGIGLAGFIITFLLCGVAASLPALYLGRAVAGAFAAAILPAAAAWVADGTTEAERPRGMAWYLSGIGVGGFIGPSLGGLLGEVQVPLWTHGRHFRLDSFSVPFSAAALLAILAFVPLRRLPEFQRSSPADPTRSATVSWSALVKTLLGILIMAAIAQAGVAIFETTFALHARLMLRYGLPEIGAVFATCGGVMIAMQLLAVGRLSRRFGESALLTAGPAMMGIGLASLGWAQQRAAVFASVALLAAGTALWTPSLATRASTLGRPHTGVALGVQSAAGSAGQIVGPLIGAALFAWSMPSAYFVGGAILVLVAVIFVVSSAASRDRRANESRAHDREESSLRR